MGFANEQNVENTELRKAKQFNCIK